MEQLELGIRDTSKLQQGQQMEAQEEGDDDWVFVSSEMFRSSDEGKREQWEAVAVYDHQNGCSDYGGRGHDQQDEEVEDSCRSDDSTSSDSESGDEVPPIQLEIIPQHICGTDRLDWCLMQFNAEVAAKICESASVAVHEASQAGAGLFLQAAEKVLPATPQMEERKAGTNLLGLPPCQLSPSRGQMSVGSSNSGQPGTSVYVGPGMLAVAKGDIFQWCKVKLRPMEVLCEMNLSRFLDADLTAIGISAHAPLTLTIASHSHSGLSVHASQPPEALPVVRSRLGPYHLLPHVVNLFFSSCVQGGSGSNFFLGLFRRMAWYLSNLNFICCVCQKRSFMPSSEVQSCQDLPCLATFNSWVHVAPCFPLELNFQMSLQQLETRLKKLDLSDDELRQLLEWHEGNSEGPEDQLFQGYGQVLAASKEPTEPTAEYKPLVPRIYFSPPGFIVGPF